MPHVRQCAVVTRCFRERPTKRIEIPNVRIIATTLPPYSSLRLVCVRRHAALRLAVRTDHVGVRAAVAVLRAAEPGGRCPDADGCAGRGLLRRSNARWRVEARVADLKRLVVFVAHRRATLLSAQMFDNSHEHAMRSGRSGRYDRGQVCAGGRPRPAPPARTLKREGAADRADRALCPMTASSPRQSSTSSTRCGRGASCGLRGPS